MVAKEIAESMGCLDEIALLQDGKPEIRSYSEKVGQYAYAFVALLDADERLQLTQILKNCGYTIAALISPKAYICSTAKVCEACMLEPFATINCNASLNCSCFIGCNSAVSCETVVGEASIRCRGATVIDNTSLPPKTEVCHGQTCYGVACTKWTPLGGYYHFWAVM